MSQALIEADPNGHLREWHQKGNCPSDVTLVFDDDPTGANLLNAIERATQTTDIVITDTEGTANRRADLACQAADLVVIPLQFSDLDLKGAIAAHNTISRIEQVSNNLIPKILVPNKLSAAITTNDECNIRDAILDTDMSLCDPGILEKSAYRQMIAAGCLLHDLPNFAKANNIQSAFDNAQAVLRSLIKFYQEAIS